MTRGKIVIIGGGVIGMAIARELHSGGASVAIVERGSCGSEASWAAAGMLGPQAETDRCDEFYRLCSASRDLYPAFAAELARETGIDIELDQAGTLCLAFSQADLQHLQERFEWQRNAALDVERWTAEQVRRSEPFVAPDVLEALYFRTDWQVDNRRLCTALRRYAEDRSIEILENTEATKLLLDEGQVKGVDTTVGTIYADEIVLAAGAWTGLLSDNGIRLPQVSPVRGQMILFQTAKRVFEHVLVSSRGYLVPRQDGRILAGSTMENCGFVKENTDAAMNELRSMAATISPSLTNLELAGNWSGLRPRAADGLPVLGRLDGISGLTVATGHYRNGILLAPLTAKLVSDSLLKLETPSEFEIFGPERFRLKSVTSV